MNGKPAAAAAGESREAGSVEAVLDRVLAPKASYYEILGEQPQPGRFLVRVRLGYPLFF